MAQYSVTSGSLFPASMPQRPRKNEFFHGVPNSTHIKRHVAALAPLAEPILALLQRDEVEIRVDVVDVADAASRVIEHGPRGSMLPDRGVALPGDGGPLLPTGVGNLPVAADVMRVLIEPVTEPVGVGGPDNDRGVVAIAAQVLLERFLARTSL